MMALDEIKEQEQKEMQGIRELEIMKGQVLRWKESYAKLATEEARGEYLADDLQEEIETLAVPYLLRLHETLYINAFQFKEFLEFCANEVQDLRNAMREEG